VNFNQGNVKKLSILVVYVVLNHKNPTESKKMIFGYFSICVSAEQFRFVCLL